MEARRYTGLIVAVVLALVGTVAIIGYVNGAEKRAQAGEHIVQVLVVKDSVPAGTSAKELGDRVGLEKISEKVKADGAVSDVKALGDKVAGTTLVPGEQVIANRFVAKSSYSATGADVQVPPGLLRTTVSLDPQRVVGGVLTPGARVAVIASFEPFDLQNQNPITVNGVTIKADGKTPSVTRTLQHKVLVTNVQLTGTVNSNDATNSKNTASSSKPGEAPTSQMLVTLALSGPDTEKLVFAQEFGKIYLSIEPLDAPSTDAGAQTWATVNQ